MHFSFGSLQLELGVKSTSSTSFIGAQASGGKLVSSKLVAFGQDQVGQSVQYPRWLTANVSFVLACVRCVFCEGHFERIVSVPWHFWLSLLLESTATVLQKGHLFEDLEERFLRYRTFKYFQCVGSCSLKNKSEGRCVLFVFSRGLKRISFRRVIFMKCGIFEVHPFYSKRLSNVHLSQRA